jgi:cation transport ATPase
MSTVTLEVGGLFEELDHLGVEKQLRAEKGVRSASANPAFDSVTIDYEESVTSADRLQRTVRAAASAAAAGWCRGTCVSWALRRCPRASGGRWPRPCREVRRGGYVDWSPKLQENL